MASAARPSRVAPSRATRRGSWSIGQVPSSLTHSRRSRHDATESTPSHASARAAALAPHIPCAPAPGGVEAEQRYVPGMPVEYGSTANRGRNSSWVSEEGAADDVTTDVVRVVHRHLRRRAHRHADDPLVEAGGESFDLGDDGLGGIAGEAMRNVGIGPQRMDVADRPGRVGEILLADEHERSPGHCPPMDRFLVVNDLTCAPTEVNGAGEAGRLSRPRDTTLDREVDLEGARAVTEPAIRTGHAIR